MIPTGTRMNFHTLQRAFDEGHVALMECTDKVTGQPIDVICAMQETKEGMIEAVPFALMPRTGSLYDLVTPPSS